MRHASPPSRIGWAQTVAAMFLERKVEPIFHPDSYGYRPKRSTLDAVAKYRERCWENGWVVDRDVQKSSTACHGG
jgi:retron-type reverse transcriptase